MTFLAPPPLDPDCAHEFIERAVSTGTVKLCVRCGGFVSALSDELASALAEVDRIHGAPGPWSDSIKYRGASTDLSDFEEDVK